jgi:signal transduction histidine kinase
MRRVDGKKITTTHSLRLIDFDGEEAILSSFQDITERDRLEELLRRSQRMEAIGQLTGGVAHDFNNVLAIILGYLDLAKSELKPDSKLLSYVNPAFTAAQNASDLTRRLLTFARKQSLQVQATNVAALLDGMVIIIRRSLGEAIEIKITNPPGLWPCLTDAAQLEQAILNLAVNARDAMPEGGILEFETSNVFIGNGNTDNHPLVEQGSYVRLSVHDSGIGMSQEVQMQIFDPFFTTKDVGKGTGLGLSMVYGFIKQSGGHIAVRSEPGDGTTFCIYLPRAEAQPDIPRQTVETSIAENRPGKTILAVEDDPELRIVVGKMLNDLGYEVLLASDGAEALRTLSNAAHVDVLLTDVILPGGMSGPALAEIAATERAAIKTLFMSGYADSAFADLGRPELESDLLKKPFTKADLGDRLRAALNS